MKYLVTLALTTLLFILPLTANATEQQLLQRLDAFLYGASINDAEIHNDFWHSDLIYTSSAGTRFGKAELMQGVRETGPVEESAVSTWYGAEDVNIRIFDNVALLTFKLVGKTDELTEYYLNSGTFVRENGKWQAINWHATKAAD
ncbi:nuclear transport factor 2 family protein [Lacimicrobium alkaliphilum]|nr:nuclear transport factor 2 family protein [Lacimicrobium alkaliphilum]